MEKETKNVQPEENQEVKKSEKESGSAFKMLLGGILIVLGLLALARWWQSLLIVIKGCLGLFLIMAGAITIAIAKE